MRYTSKSSEKISLPQINTKKPYTYEKMCKDIMLIKEAYPFIEVDIIGKSVLGKPIYSISFGIGKKCLSYNASHHANEWITSLVMMKFICEFAQKLVKNEKIFDYNLKDIYKKSTIKVVPMVNPDGVNLVIKGLVSENKKYHDLILKANNESRNFDGWNANIRGVDINHNYDASWDLYKNEIEPSLNIIGPAPKRFSGPSPVSEPETYAMVKFTQKNNFEQILAYHSQGEIIYWDYMNMAPKKSFKIAKKYSKVSGYDIGGIAKGPAAVGGYKDLFIKEFNRPGFTVEVGNGTNPLPLSQFTEIYIKNAKILLLAPYL